MQGDKDWLDDPEAVEAELRWQDTVQDFQREPEGEWRTWLFLAGRNTGKTYTGANWARRMAYEHPGSIGGVIARTHKDLVQTVIEGPSGLLKILPQSAKYASSKGSIYLPNESVIHLYSAEKPDSLRGPNLSWAWCDELAAWDHLAETWEQLMMATRVGRPRIFISTTPRNKPVLKMIKSWEDTRTVVANTFQNKYQSPEWRRFVKEQYEGTRIGRQELYAEILDDVEGALWTPDMIDAAYGDSYPILKRVVVGVDPSGGGTAETGIIVAGVGKDNNQGYVLEDASMSGSPAEWGRQVVRMYHKWDASRIVVEKNYGGEMAEHTIRTVDPMVPIKLMTASKGKILRAEPVAALYEKGVVHHIGRFPKLEDQMCQYTQDDKVSPDRLDALVWALSELMVQHRTVNKHIAPVSMTRTSHWRSPDAAPSYEWEPRKP